MNDIKKNKRINIGVVGCGYWGPNLIRNFQSLPESRVTIACDQDKKRLAHIKQLYNDIKITTNIDDLINDKSVDAICIATPVWTHFEIAKKCLEAGKHTFIEKPMASTTYQCKELFGLAESKGLTLMVGHTFVYSAAVKKIKKIIDDGDIGDILYIGSQRMNLGLFQKDINAAWDLAPHDISIILYVMQNEIVSVNCQGEAHINSGIEDVTNMSLTFKNKAFATIQNSWIDPNKVRRMTFVGSKRMILYDDNEPLEKIKIYDKRVEVPPHYDTFAEFHYSYHYGDMYAPYLKQTEPLKTQCSHFLTCIIEKKVPDSSALDGLKVVEILEAATISLKKGGSKVYIEELDKEQKNEFLGQKEKIYANAN